MHYELMWPSKYLKAVDLIEKGVKGNVGVPVTIVAIEQEELVRVGGKKDMGWVGSFRGKEKQMVLGKVHGRALAKITGSTNGEEWLGWTVYLGWEDGVWNPSAKTKGPALRFLENRPGKPPKGAVDAVADDTFSTPSVKVDEELPPLDDDDAPDPFEPPPGALSTDNEMHDPDDDAGKKAPKDGEKGLFE